MGELLTFENGIAKKFISIFFSELLNVDQSGVSAQVKLFYLLITPNRPLPFLANSIIS